LDGTGIEKKRRIKEGLEGGDEHLMLWRRDGLKLGAGGQDNISKKGGEGDKPTGNG